jgi:hypothetical protein
VDLRRNKQIGRPLDLIIVLQRNTVLRKAE